MSSASDTFTSGSDISLSAYSIFWSDPSNAFEINAGGQCYCNVNADSCAYYTGTWAANQTSVIRIAILGGSYIGPAVRCSGTNTGLVVQANDSHIYLASLVAGSFGSIADDAFAGAVGDFLMIDVVDSTVSVYQQVAGSGPFNLLLSGSAGAIASGNPGISGYGNDSSRLDDWSAFDTPAAGGGFPFPRPNLAKLLNF